MVRTSNYYIHALRERHCAIRQGNCSTWGAGDYNCLRVNRSTMGGADSHVLLCQSCVPLDVGSYLLYQVVQTCCGYNNDIETKSVTSFFP